MYAFFFEVDSHDVIAGSAQQPGGNRQVSSRSHTEDRGGGQERGNYHLHHIITSRITMPSFIQRIEGDGRQGVTEPFRPKVPAPTRPPPPPPPPTRRTTRPTPPPSTRPPPPPPTRPPPKPTRPPTTRRTTRPTTTRRTTRPTTTRQTRPPPTRPPPTRPPTTPRPPPPREARKQSQSRPGKENPVANSGSATVTRQFNQFPNFQVWVNFHENFSPISHFQSHQQNTKGESKTKAQSSKKQNESKRNQSQNKNNFNKSSSPKNNGQNQVIEIVIKCSCFRENVISKSWASFGV